MPEINRKPRRKYCQFCKDHTEYIDYKDTQMLRKFMTERGKMLPGRVTGANAKQQRQVKRAIRRARVMGLLP